MNVEGASATINVILSSPAVDNVIIDFIATSGTADTNDYLGTTFTVNIMSGNDVGSFVIDTVDDSLVEGNETMILTGGLVSGNISNIGQGLVTIIDND